MLFLELPAICLYKYLKPERADAMVQTGSIRIGTLNEYRELEAKDVERGDIGEGTRTLHSDDKPRVYNSTAELPPILRDIACGPGGLATNGPNAIVINSRVPDVYVYCATERFDRMVMERFGGACVRIENVGKFFEAVDEQFRTKLQMYDRFVADGYVGRCVYADRRQNYHTATPVDDCFLKSPGYKHQYEVRAVWRPDKLPITGISFECMAGAQYCKRHPSQ